jgi:hypothetical protein
LLPGGILAPPGAVRRSTFFGVLGVEIFGVEVFAGLLWRGLFPVGLLKFIVSPTLFCYSVFHAGQELQIRVQKPRDNYCIDGF